MALTSTGNTELPHVATNMCLSLGKKIVSSKMDPSLKFLNDGKDATVWEGQGPFWVAIQINATDIEDADYLMVHYRSSGVGDWNDASYSLNKYKILTSHNSTDGYDGDWKVVKKVKNRRRDRVDVIPNNKPKWIKVAEYSNVHVSLSRLDVFRAAPEGQKNDYWIFFGASVIAMDMGAGVSEDKSPSLFSDLISSFYPDRYPIVINSAKSGEVIQKGVKRQKKWVLPENPKATFFAFHHGGNNVSLMRPFPGGKDVLDKSYRQIIYNARNYNMLPIPSRLTFRNYPEVVLPHQPHSEGLGSLPYNEFVIDPIIRELCPYAVDLVTGKPIMDPYPWYRDNQHQLEDSVHHDVAGAVALNEMFAIAASKIVYEPLEAPLLVYNKFRLQPHYSRMEIPTEESLQKETAQIQSSDSGIISGIFSNINTPSQIRLVSSPAPEAEANSLKIIMDPPDEEKFIPPPVHLNILEVEYGLPLSVK